MICLPMLDRKTILQLALLLVTVTIVYLGHFHNTFHFDDVHTVTRNPYIRELSNIPKFFSDARTFSVQPGNRVYRPLVSASLAIDYHLGGGRNPFYFQLSTFCWFLVQLTLIYVLFRRICDFALPNPGNRTVALLAAVTAPTVFEFCDRIIPSGGPSRGAYFKLAGQCWISSSNGASVFSTGLEIRNRWPSGVMS